MNGNISPRQLLARLAVYYAVLLTAVIGLLLVDSDALQYLPFAGSDALDSEGFEITETSFRMSRDTLEGRGIANTPEELAGMILFLFTTLITTIVIMLPVTWTYAATRYEYGPSKVFVRALILMPICATTVVLLIQDSLALAFGLAALVAAVRFRVALTDAVDGIYIFAAICVGLAGGIGFMGIALIMTIVFTVTAAILWNMDYGRNPIDDARREAKAAKLAAKGG